MILLGYKMLQYQPDVAEAIQLIQEQTFVDPKWLSLCSSLTRHDTEWVLQLGTFKAAFLVVGVMITHCIALLALHCKHRFPLLAMLELHCLHCIA